MDERLADLAIVALATFILVEAGSDRFCQTFGEHIYCQRNSTTTTECMQECGREHCLDGTFVNKTKTCFTRFNNTRIGDCENIGTVNIQHWTYSVGWASGVNNAKILHVDYEKIYDFTGLRVRFAGNLRSGTSANHGSEFYFKFNDARCTSPHDIDYIHWDKRGANHHIHGEFEGICENLPAGSIRIKFMVTQLPGRSNDAYTGWSEEDSLTVEEVDMRGNTTPCAHLNTLNVKQHSIESMADETNNGTLNATVFTFTKEAHDTAIRLRWIGSLFGKKSAEGPACLRFFFTINGKECRRSGPIDGAMAWLEDTNSNTEMQITKIIEGICENLLAGSHQIALNTGDCLHGDYQRMEAKTGDMGTSRIIAEEIRLRRQQGTRAPNSVFNIRYWNWYNLNITGDGEIVRVIYPKMSASSGLRLYMNGVAMTSTNGGTCAKWKFLYNGGACPEANHDINGLYLQAHTYQHMMPISVSGICRGLGAGNLAITLDCESCANRQIINPVTGWETTLSVTAEEVELA